MQGHGFPLVWTSVQERTLPLMAYGLGDNYDSYAIYQQYDHLLRVYQDSSLAPFAAHFAAEQVYGRFLGTGVKYN
jgi:hypothetical protein